jgi:hypothetical protein
VVAKRAARAGVKKKTARPRARAAVKADARERAAAAVAVPNGTIAGPANDVAACEKLQAELNQLRERERQIIEVLGSTSPERILHDIRNLINEVGLLRFLADKAEAPA